MFKFLSCKRVVKLGALLCCHTLILTVLLTPIRIISVVNLSEVDFPEPLAEVQEIPADFLHESTELLNGRTMMKTHNETAGPVFNISKTASIVNTETLVNAKLSILHQLLPNLRIWYQEGLISHPPRPLANMTRNPICALFKKEATINRHTVLNVFGEEYLNQNSSGITLATQGTISRMRPFIETAKNWEGPIQVVFHLGYEDFASLLTVFQEEDARKYILERKNIIVNFVVKIGNFYPINYLRNVGLNNTRTQWIFLTDIDFVPSKEVYTAARAFLSNHNAETEKKVYIVPAFSDLIGNLSHFPENKTQLMELWKANLVQETQKGTAGQKNTDYKRWPGATSPYTVKWRTDYEPYIIGPTKTLPTYDEYFLQRVLDKCAHIMETSVKGFEFWVLPDVFIIHLKHERHPGQEYHAGCAHDYYHKEFKGKVRKKYSVNGPRRLTMRQRPRS